MELHPSYCLNFISYEPELGTFTTKSWVATPFNPQHFLSNSELSLILLTITSVNLFNVSLYKLHVPRSNLGLLPILGPLPPQVAPCCQFAGQVAAIDKVTLVEFVVGVGFPLPHFYLIKLQKLLLIKQIALFYF